MRVGQRKRKRNTIIASLIIGFIIIISVIFVYRYINENAEVENEVIVYDKTFEVTGYFGDTYQLEDIKSLELKDELPTFIEKRHGFGIGQVRRGDFITKEYGKCRIYVLIEEGPYLHIQMNEGLIILNHLNSEKTNTLYKELIEKVKDEQIN